MTKKTRQEGKEGDNACLHSNWAIWLLPSTDCTETMCFYVQLHEHGDRHRSGRDCFIFPRHSRRPYSHLRHSRRTFSLCVFQQLSSILQKKVHSLQPACS